MTAPIEAVPTASSRLICPTMSMGAGPVYSPPETAARNPPNPPFTKGGGKCGIESPVIPRTCGPLR
jgi:hypothetical protein